MLAVVMENSMLSQQVERPYGITLFRVVRKNLIYPIPARAHISFLQEKM